MTDYWKLPVTCQSLILLVGIIKFYHQFAPYLELKLKPLRRLCHTYYRQTIPMMALTLDIIALFNDLKVGITSSPVLFCFNPEKPTFFITDWSAEDMGWILMQQADDEESQKATEHLKKPENAHSTSLNMAPD